MSESHLVAARDAVVTAFDGLCAGMRARGGQDLIEHALFVKQLIRRAQYELVATLARLDGEGEFAERGVRPAAGVADLLGCREPEARRMVALGRALFPTALDGSPLQPRLPVTAAALAAAEIDQAHAEVIEHALSGDAAGRIGPERCAGLEQELVGFARQQRPDELARTARHLLDLLDQDGPAPDPDIPQVNELHISPCPDGVGGRIKARLDAPTFEVFARAIHALVGSASDEGKSLGQRQADALGELCEHALDEARLPVDGGERPHVTVILDERRLREAARGVMLDYGGQTTVADLRYLLCDCKVIPAVSGGPSQPLDIGRERRCVSLAQRRAIAARDRGCAHPGCQRPPARCQVHHIRDWVNGGHTNIDDLVMLCRTHHRMVHQSDWQIRMRDGRPEFLPPKWLDPTQTPRRQPTPA